MRQRENGDILRNIQFLTGVPSRLIHNQDGVSVLRNCAGYLGEVELHPVQVSNGPGRVPPGPPDFNVFSGMLRLRTY